MARVEVELGARSYPILIERKLLARAGGLIREALPKAGRALVITDTNVGPLYGQQLGEALKEAGIDAAEAQIPAGESSKSLAIAATLYEACAGMELERSSVIVALGGGVVGDLAGFVAATYLRGIPFVQVPTSLLAQVDSSVGGKTGVDLPQGKNLVGAFHQPSLVLADLDVLTTLPERELRAGLAEVVKHAVIKDAAFLEYLEANWKRIIDVDTWVLERVVETNCRIKAAVVAADEREESGLRAILNFGHTVGHALEAYSEYSALHGECVAFGMMAALGISREVGVLRDPELPGRVERLLKRFGLPTTVAQDFPVGELTPLMQRDKKVEAGKIRWVLAVGPGRVALTPDVPADTVLRVLHGLRG